MSSMIPARQYIRVVEKMREQFLQTNNQLGQLTAQNNQQVQELEQRANVALTELTAAILPELNPAALSRAVHLTGYIPLVQNDPLAAMAKSREALTQRSVEIEADRRYRDRLLLRAPRIGLLTREIAELEEFRAPLQEILTACEHPRLPLLLTVGYGTPAYDVPFWRWSYYADWKAADEICERFGKQRTFAELRTDYLTARDTVAVYDTKLAKLREEVRIGEALEHEHDDSLRQIEKLPETFLINLRAQLVNYLRDIDLVAFGDRLALAPQIDGLAKRYQGLRKQRSYLSDSGQHLLLNTTASVVQTLQSLSREIQKYQRPKLAYSYVPTGRLDRIRQLEQRNAKARTQTERYQQTSVVVYSFQDYRYGRLDDDFLWWDLMAHTYSQYCETPQKVYANFIPEVAQFRASHPGYRYQAADDLDLLAEAEAQAAAASLGPDDDRRDGVDIS